MALLKVDPEDDNILAPIISEKDNQNNDILIKDKDYGNVIDSYYFVLQDNKQTTRFIKRVEASIRRSNEYSYYIRYLRQDLGINFDVTMPNINQDVATLEMHHYPFTLYDICEMVLNDHLINNDDTITSFSIAKEVLSLHYQNLIGLASLSKTNHELTHAGKLFIPLESVFGNVNKFVKRYYKVMYSDQIKKYNELVKKSNDLRAKEIMDDIKSEASRRDSELLYDADDIES